MTFKKNHIMKMIVSASMATLSIIASGSTALADGIGQDLSASGALTGTTNNGVPNGISDIIKPVKSLEDQFKELLNGCSNPEQREIILKKAVNMGISINDLTGVSLSDSDIAILNSKVSSKIAIETDVTSRRTMSNNTSSRAATSGVVVAGVEMPDYVLWPTIYRQEFGDWCTAGTIETVGKYIGANPPSQADIMAFWKDYWNVNYPDLPLMRNYMNYHLPDKGTSYVPYVVKKYYGSQTTFNTDLKNNVLNYQPMMIMIKSADTTNWPFKTDGHASLVNGLITWEDNKYFIGDPYYFSKYVSGADDTGEHKRTWSELNASIQSYYGSDNVQYLT